MLKNNPTTIPKILKSGYYTLTSGEHVKVTHDTGTFSSNQKYPRRIYTKSLQGEERELREVEIRGITTLQYTPSIKELWCLAKTAPMALHPHATREIPADDPIIWMDRFQLFFSQLIEFNFIKFETLGYFDFDGHICKSLRRDTAYKLAEKFYFTLDSKNENHANFLEHLEEWANNPSEENRLSFFKRLAFIGSLPRLGINTECPVTGEIFEWEFDGETIQPILRFLNQEERKVKTKALKTELNKLRNKKIRTAKEETQLATLADVLEGKNGWMRGYYLVSTDKAIPFLEKYADPKTGKFPRAVVEIDIPTGELVFANHFFPQLKDLPKNERDSHKNSVSHSQGRNNLIYFHARVNQAFYIPLSNSPSVWQNKAELTKLRVGRAFEEPEAGQWHYSEASKDWDECGQICTDLRAFHACDRCRLPIKIEADYFSVTVPPGRYQLTNHFEHEDSKNGVFCEIQKIGEISNE